MLAKNFLTIKKVLLTTTAPAYSAGDQINVVKTIPGVTADNNGAVILKSLVVIDEAKQKIGMTIFFFSKSPTNAVADNAAADIADAEMNAKCLGSVVVVAGDYADLANSSVATVKNIGLLVKSEDIQGGAVTGEDIYCLVVTNGTPTYGAGQFLSLRLGFAGI